MAKRQKKTEEGGDGFMTTYADMVTLLMAFFVMLFAMSSVDDTKFLTMLKGLEEAFGNSAYQQFILQGGPSVIGANQPDGADVPSVGGAITVVAIDRDLSELVEAVSGAETSVESPSDGQNPDEVDDPHVLDLSELAEVEAAIIDATTRLGIQDLVTTQITPDGLTIVLSTDDILFQSGSADLADGLGREFVGVVAGVLQGFDNPIRVHGHTDDVPLGDSGYSNWDLSAARAIAVNDLFIDEFEITPARLEVIGHADTRPLVPNDSDENRSKNRRVEIVVSVDALEQAALRVDEATQPGEDPVVGIDPVTLAEEVLG
ncbi:MAG: flagellar motor protein MotB [Actinomycetia bacterium]|nr:flagellar motor protein MotB [Actinomycetes bacterium]MCP4960847.1 flagellar motor protein MotB [Actinomycetes bacterium]